MPSELLARVQRLINPSVARDVNLLAGSTGVQDAPVNQDVNNVPWRRDPTHTPLDNTTAHWAGGIGGVLRFPSSITIHGTSGWISYQSAENSGALLMCRGAFKWVAKISTWYDKRGVASQFTIDANGTIFPTIGREQADGDLLMVYHNDAMNSCSIGIEQTDFGDEASCAPPVTSNALLFRLNEMPGTTATTEDLAGRRVYAQLHPRGSEDIVLVWFALDTYAGPGDIDTTTTPPEVPVQARWDGWNNSLFTERDYRSLVTLARYLAENNSIPRNFPTLPYARRGDSGDDAMFRQLLLGDPTADQIATRIGLDANVARADGAPWQNAYLHASHPTVAPLVFWKNFFGLPTDAHGQAAMPSYRGFLSHVMNGGHACPGPLFDWHRFAREMWDWWWYPFDFVAGTPVQPATTRRAYCQARMNTRLVEYYYDAVGSAADYAAKSVTYTPPLTTSSYEQFAVGSQVPINALANGVIVAACLPSTSTAGGSTGFVLTRHEYFTPETSGEIKYDTPPTRVWSLIRYVTAPGFQVNQIGPANPEWLNRLVIRLTECELAVKYNAAHGAGTSATATKLQHGWAHHPFPPATGAPATTVPTTGEQIERDATAYRDLADGLVAGKAMLFPREVAGGATPVRMILGDFLGTPSDKAGGGIGIQVEIFSRDRLTVPGAVQRSISVSGESWWPKVTAAARHEASNADDLPPNGVVWAYPTVGFLQWANEATWRHEWKKYFVMDFNANPPVPAPTPVRPNSRTSF